MARKPITWWFDDIELSMHAEGVRASETADLDGWMTEDQLTAAGHSIEDLRELAAKGIIRTVGEGPNRVYSLAAVTGTAARRITR
jgi:hypothetical protein